LELREMPAPLPPDCALAIAASDAWM